MEEKGEYAISFRREDQQIERVHGFLAQSYWAEGIPIAAVEQSVANSMCVGVFHHGQQVGFARIVTDTVTFAYLCDVYVLEEHRGKGLASWMLGAIAAHPKLQGLRRFMLATRDAHELYSKHGFTPVKKPESLMERMQPPPWIKPQSQSSG